MLLVKVPTLFTEHNKHTTEINLIILSKSVLRHSFNIDVYGSKALFTRTDTEIWTEILPVKVLHCVNGDGLKFRQNGCGINSS